MVGFQSGAVGGNVVAAVVAARRSLGMRNATRVSAVCDRRRTRFLICEDGACAILMFQLETIERDIDVLGSPRFV